MSRSALLAPSAAFALACSDTPPEASPPEVRPPEHVDIVDSMPRPDLLWTVDLSEYAVDQMTHDELWSLGLEFLRWPEDRPESAVKAETSARLIAAKFHQVGDIGYSNDLGYFGDGVGYSNDLGDLGYSGDGD